MVRNGIKKMDKEIGFRFRVYGFSDKEGREIKIHAGADTFKLEHMGR
jgi:hypothetical protein